MFDGLFICICRSVCWDNVIVKIVVEMFGGVLLFRGLFRVSVISFGLLKPLQFGKFVMF